MWRILSRADRWLVQHPQANLGARRTLLAAAGNKRALDKSQLYEKPPPKAEGTKAAAAVPTSTPPPSSGGGGGSSATPVLLVGTAALMGGAAYMYYQDKDAFMEKMPWNPQSESSPSSSSATSRSIDAAVASKEKTLVEEKETCADTTVTEKESTENQSTATVATGGGNRVLQIDVSPEMRNQKKEAAATVETLPHPSTGNRVTVDAMVVKKEKKKRAKKTSSTSQTQEAVRELQTSATMEAAKSLVESHQALWTSLESNYFTDLDSLSKSQLKTRVVQLAAEMKDRTQWEAVRLKEFLALKEKETAQHYMELLQKQRLEFEEILATRLREQDAVFHGKLKEALDQKDASIQSVVNAALEAQQEEHNQDKEAFATKFENETQIELNKKYGEQMEAYKQTTEQDLQLKVSTLSQLSEKLQKLELALEASQRNQQGSSKAHKLSAAALALSDILETHNPAGKEVRALQTAAGEDGIISTAVRTLPPTVQTEGVPTLPELQTKFEEKYSTFRQAALVPQGRPGLDGQLAGMLFATLKYPPQPDDPAPEDDPDSAEYVLARARKHVQRGELGSAIDELEKLQGQVAFVVDDWKKTALDRVAVEKAVKVIKLECALLHESVVQ